MTVRHGVGLTWAAGLLALGVLAVCVLAADPPKAKPADGNAVADPLCPVPKDGETDALYGSRACASCHILDPDKPDPLGTHPFDALDSRQFVLLSEGKTFQRHDPHTQAYERMVGERGEKIAEAVKYDKTKPLTWTACLTCHATDMTAGDHGFSPPAPPLDRPTDPTAGRFNTSQGVGCVACHGVRAEWQSSHYKEPASGTKMPWRDETTADEKTKAGMRDLRNPAVKANLCASCHVGSAELGRVVTHDMYAAGHPPLPPFELVTYQNGEPRHWEHPDKPYSKVKLDNWKQYHAHPKVAEVQAAREYAAGAIAALRAEAEMLAADARRTDGGPLDFARFDCSSCHHDLKSPSDRPVKQPPGRPPLRRSTDVSATLVARHAAALPDKPFGDAARFEKAWGDLKAAATAKPFGDGTVESKATDVRKWCDDFLAKQGGYERPVYSPEETDKLRKLIAETAVGNDAKGDPEAALVLTWGYLALGGKNPLPNDNWYELEKELKLPPGVRRQPKAEGRTPVPIDFISRQKAVNAFRADKFTEAFKGLK